MTTRTSSLFQRLILPGLAFKSVVIGGGYVTGRELVEFFLPSGPWGGIFAMIVAAMIWSIVCCITFMFARATQSHDYRTFFRNLLGPFWRVFDLAYLALIIIVLSVFSAAANTLATESLNWPAPLGGVCLAALIVLFTTYGNEGVEQLFKYVSFLLYGIYAIFLGLCIAGFGDRILGAFALDVPSPNWAGAGVAYASYSVVGATIILPVVRHMQSQRDAAVAGLLCGGLAMLPAIVFFACMCAFYPQIGNEPLPANFLLAQLQWPAFQKAFQLMIFAALLESGAGCVHAINERISSARAEQGRSVSASFRFFLVALLLVIANLVAARFGLVALIAEGYSAMSYVFIAVFIVPLLTLGVWRLCVGRNERRDSGPLPINKTIE
jgi:uncharacterized membrane protein YkvI